MSTYEPTVRPATVHDAEAIVRLSDQLGYPSTEEETAQGLLEVNGQTGHALYVAEADGRLVGWVHVYVTRCWQSRRPKSPASSWIKIIVAAASGECSLNTRSAGRKDAGAVLCGSLVRSL